MCKTVQLIGGCTPPTTSMASMLTTDQAEEDAADLQFPKENLTVVGEAIGPVCSGCAMVLQEPYIRCAECVPVIHLCLPCFARGVEFAWHENNHGYIILKNDFPLFDGSWQAREELELLDAILECGYGNWGDIAKRVQTKSANECKIHYQKMYIENPPPELPNFGESDASVTLPPPIEFSFGSEEPPRFQPSTTAYRSMSGYNAARSDFEIEYDNHAELDLVSLDWDRCDPEDEDYELVTSLQAAVVQGYNRRLKERARRYKIIRNHGLILMRKTFSWLHTYDRTITKSFYQRLLPFMQLMTGLEFDFLMESLHYEGELKQCILQLQELRENGIQHFHSCKLFHKLRQQREERKKNRKMYLHPTLCWKNLLNVIPGKETASVLPVNVPCRRQAPPLQIIGLPGYEKLDPKERELCALVRLVPESFLEFKSILVNECKKVDGLKLAQARVLIKIDVNKTRKLYDFLMQEGLIYQPS